jgi:hypothetical protein
VLWRALIRSLGAQDHRVVFFERDVPYYAEHRDLTEIDGGRLVLYRDWRELAAEARQQLADADAAVVTSYCPDALAASALVFDSRALRVFYDLDSPVTLAPPDGRRAALLVSGDLRRRRAGRTRPQRSRAGGDRRGGARARLERAHRRASCGGTREAGGSRRRPSTRESYKYAWGATDRDKASRHLSRRCAG